MSPMMSPIVLAALYQHSAALFASVLLIVVFFLIGRVARLSQPVAMALALAPALLVLAVDHFMLPAAAAHLI